MQPRNSLKQMSSLRVAEKGLIGEGLKRCQRRNADTRLALQGEQDHLMIEVVMGILADIRGLTM